MLKQNQTTLNTLHIIIDAVCSTASVFLSYFLLKNLFQYDFLFELNISKNMMIVWLIAIALLQIFSNFIFDLYRSYRSNKFTSEIVNLVRSGMAVFLVMILLSLSINELYRFQIAIFLYFLIYTFLAALYRFIRKSTLRYLRTKGYNKKYIVLLGNNDCTENFIKKINDSPDLGYEIAGYFDIKPHGESKLNYLGSFKSLSRYFEACHTDEAVLMLSDESQPYMDKLIADCESWGIKFSIIPNAFASFTSRIYISSFDGMPIMSLRRIPLDSKANRFVKRTFDIIFASVFLILLSPVMLLTAMIIKLTSPGKIIFKQERVGLNNKPFIMYKFRSMREETEGDLSMTQKNDKRLTPIGGFIRRFSIDELPQLVNVIKGDMSLVGPRPEIPFYVKKFRKSIPLYMIKHYVKPGITGWAQVNDLRGGDTSIEERIKHDIYYIEHWSVAFDIKILFKTVFQGIFSKNAR